MNIEHATLTTEEEARAQEFVVEQCLKSSKRKGDAAWREAEQITGLGDYLPADEGMAPQGAERN